MSGADASGLESVLSWPCNEGILEQVAKEHLNKRLALYVGAGVSADYQLPTWSDLLRQLCPNRPGDRAQLEALLVEGRHEHAASLIHEAAGEVPFQSAVKLVFDRAVHPPAKAQTTVRTIASLFRGPILTTNFDRILETELQAIRGVDSQNFLDAPRLSVESANLIDEDALVLRLHGSFDQPISRILTTRDYEEAYGADPETNGRALPRFLRHAFFVKSVLFVGCGMSMDRPLRVLAHCAALDPLTRHFAILPLPAGYSHGDVRPPNYPEAHAHLTRCNLQVLWIPAGGFELVPQILERALRESETVIRVVERPAVVLALAHSRLSVPENGSPPPSDSPYGALCSTMQTHGFRGPVNLRLESSAVADSSVLAFWFPISNGSDRNTDLEQLLAPFDRADLKNPVLDCRAAAVQVQQLLLDRRHLEGAAREQLRSLLEHRAQATVRQKPAIALTCNSPKAGQLFAGSTARLFTWEQLSVMPKEDQATRTVAPIGFQLSPGTAQPFTYLAYVSNVRLPASHGSPRFLRVQVPMNLARKQSDLLSKDDAKSLAIALANTDPEDEWRPPILELIRSSEIWMRIDEERSKLTLHGLYYLTSPNANRMTEDAVLPLRDGEAFFVRHGEGKRLARVRLAFDGAHGAPARWRLVFRPYSEPEPIPLFELATRPQDAVFEHLVDSLELCDRSTIPP